MIEVLRELGVPFAAVLIIAITAWQEHNRRSSVQDSATVEIQESIVEGLREDLVRAAAEARGARDEARAARTEAENERAARRKVEDEFYTYRVDARAWTAQLVRQLTEVDVEPADPPPGFQL